MSYYLSGLQHENIIILYTFGFKTIQNNKLTIILYVVCTMFNHYIQGLETEDKEC